MFLFTADDLTILQPREALLRYAEVADKDPQWTGGKRSRADIVVCCFVYMTWRFLPKL